MNKRVYKVYTDKGMYVDKFLSPQHARLHVAKVTGRPVIKVELPIVPDNRPIFLTDLEERHA